jgi:hypothetical protein
LQDFCESLRIDDVKQVDSYGRWPTDDQPGIVVARTAIGGERVIARMVGEQLSRIC